MMPRPTASGPIRTERVVYARRAAGARQPVVAARIGAPEVRPEAGWMCRVHCPPVIGHDRWIVGADPAQARALAGEFAMRMLEHHGCAFDPVQRNRRACRTRPPGV